MGTDSLRLGAAQAGDEATFEAAFAEHYPRVYVLLYRLVGDQADDLAQEVFLQLYRRPPQDAETRLDAWLYRVATHLGYNALRAHRRWERYRDLVGRAHPAGDWGGNEPDPAMVAEQHDEQRRVRAALARLNRQQASLLVLRYSELSYREIAETLGLAPGSIGALLARAERAFERAYRQVSGRHEGGEQ